MCVFNFCFREVHQPDGTMVALKENGNEFKHWTSDMFGKLHVDASSGEVL